MGGRTARRRARGGRDERGAAALEFALIVPILLLLVYGIISYGYLLSFRQAMSQSTSEAARLVAVAPTGLPRADVIAGARTRINDALGSYGVSCTDTGRLVRGGQDAGTCTVTVGTCTGATVVAGASCATVALDYLYQQRPLLPAVPLMSGLLPDELRYNSVAEAN